MTTLRRTIQSLLSLLCLLSLNLNTEAQCPQIYDGFGVPANSPEFISCTGGDYTVYLQLTANVGPYTIDWGDGNTTSGTSLLNTQFLQHTYLATVNTYTITFTDVANSCTITGLVVMEEPVNASIQIPIGGVTAVCAPQSIEFINSSTNNSSTTTYTWDFGDGSPQLVLGPANHLDTVSHVYQKNTVSCETVVTLTAENYCSFGNPTSAQFNPLMVWDVDTAIIQASATFLCYPDTTVHFTNQTDKNCFQQGNVAQRYEYWNFGDHWGLGYDSIIPWVPFDPPARPGYTIAFPGIGTYTIMMIDSNICGQDTAYQTVVIGPPPVAGISSNKDTICAGDNVTFYNNSSGGSSYRWNFDKGAGYQNLGGGNKTRTYPNPGTYTIEIVTSIPNSSNACTDTASVELVVLPSPVANFYRSPAGDCDSVTVSFLDNSTNALTWDWDFGNGNTSNLQLPSPENYTSPGNYTISLTVENALGCTHTQNQNVTVYQTPTPNFTVGNICEDEIINFLDSSIYQLSDPVVNWSWDFGDANTGSGSTIGHTYADSGSFSVQLIVNTANCQDTISKTITVHPKPTANFVADTLIGCSPLAINFTDSSNLAVNYVYDFGDGDTSHSASPSHIFTNTNLYDITYTTSLSVESAFGCTDQFSRVVTVLGIPEANYTENHIAQCAPFSVDFADSSTNAVTWAWYFGDGDSAIGMTNTSHIYNNTGNLIANYPASLVITGANGCADTNTQLITVYPEPIFPFTALPDSGCSPLPVAFPPVPGAANYTWYFGDGDSIFNLSPIHSYSNVGIVDSVYTAMLVATSPFGCNDTNTQDVRVYPRPIANFDIPDSVGCGPFTATFNDSSLLSVSYAWSFGDLNTSTTSANTFNHVYENTTNSIQNYSSVLVTTSSNGCTDTATHNVMVYPQVVAGFSADTADCHPLNNIFTNTSVNATIFSWDFGDGVFSTSMNPGHAFNYLGSGDTTYSTVLAASSVYGCTDTADLDITVFAQPTIYITASAITGCSPLAIDFAQNTTNSDTYAWNFGDGNTSVSNNDTVSHTFVNTTGVVQQHTVQLLVQNSYGCMDSASILITVYPEITANFTLNDDEGCNPLPVTFTDASIGNANANWLVDGMSIGTGGIFNHVFNYLGTTDTTYSVGVEAVSSYGCIDTLLQSVTVHHTPTALLTTSAISGCSPIEIDFYNNSTNFDSTLWSFGDGNHIVTDSSSVSHIYVNPLSTPVTYTPQMKVYTLYGCADSTDLNIQVYPEIIADFQLSDSVGCSSVNSAFQNTSYQANMYAWNFGDGQVSTQTHPNHNFAYVGANDTTYNVELLATSVYGCTDTAFNQVTVYKQADANFNIPITAACSPFSVTTLNTSSQADWYQWDYANGQTSNNANGIVPVYTNSTGTTTTYNIQLIAGTLQGCNDTISYPVNVHSEVIPDFTLSDTAGCSVLSVNFQNASLYANSFHWDLGNGVTANQINAASQYVYNGTNDTTFTITLTATSSNGCSDTVSKDLTVYKQAVSQFNIPVGAGCAPFVVSTNNQSTHYDWVYWDYGNGQTSSAFNGVQATYNNTSGFTTSPTIMLVAGTNEGCNDTTYQNINVYSEVVADFAMSDTAGCSSLDVTFQNTSSFTNGYQWTFGNGNGATGLNTSETFVYQGNTDTTYAVTLIAHSLFGCSDTITKNVTVYKQALAQFNLLSNAECSPFSIAKTNNSLRADWYQWDYGNGTTSSTMAGTPPTYTNTSGVPQQYPVQLIAGTVEGCNDTLTQNITVYPEVTAEFTLDSAGCSPHTTNINNFSLGANSYMWSPGNGILSTQFQPSFTYTFNGIGDTTYFTVLEATSIYGCVDTDTIEVNVYHTPDANFATDITAACQPFSVNIDNLSSGASTLTWDFGDGTGSTSFASTQNKSYAHNFLTPVNYEIELVALTNYGCSDTATSTVTVYPRIEADFSGDSTGCSPLNVDFKDLSFGAVNFNWDFGNGNNSTQQNPDEIFTNFTTTAINYPVTLGVSNAYGCTDTIQKYVTVYPEVNAQFTATPAVQNWPNSTVTFNNLTVGNGLTYIWDYNDGTQSQPMTSTAPHTYQYASFGVYVPELIAYNNFCSDTVASQIVIHPPPPVADFSGAGEGCAPLTVDFTNLSVHDTANIWDFGDGNTSTIDNISYTYFTPGTYTVALTVYGTSGSDQVVRFDTVKVYPRALAYFEYYPGVVSAPSEQVTFTNGSSEADYFWWDFGDGNTSEDTYVQHTYLDVGEYVVTLIADNEWGCADTFTAPNAVVAEADGQINVPNVFTPDLAGGNGGYYDPRATDNKVFHPQVVGAENFYMAIFNRWGEKMFETFDQYQGWDGYFRGELAQKDVYVYKIEVEYTNGRSETLVGDLTLLR